MDWLKGKFTGNNRFFYEIWVFPVDFPLNQIHWNKNILITRNGWYVPSRNGGLLMALPRAAGEPNPDPRWPLGSYRVGQGRWISLGSWSQVISPSMFHLDLTSVPHVLPRSHFHMKMAPVFHCKHGWPSILCPATQHPNGVHWTSGIFRD